MKGKAPTARMGQHRNIAPAGGDFYQSVAEVLRAARASAYRAVNFAMVEAYWNIGRMIVEEEQQKREGAASRAALIRPISRGVWQGIRRTGVASNVPVLLSAANSRRIAP